MDSCPYRVRCSSSLCVKQECKSTVQKQNAPSVSTVSYQLEDTAQKTPGKKPSEVKLVASKSCVETSKTYLFHIDKCLDVIWIQLLPGRQLDHGSCSALYKNTWAKPMVDAKLSLFNVCNPQITVGEQSA